MLQKQLTQQYKSKSTHRLYLSPARDQTEIAEAQRLRYKVFAEEMGTQLTNANCLDIDGFDQFCDRLLARESNTHQVIGTYRILNSQQPCEAGGYYSAGEFDLSRFSQILRSTVEVGRACYTSKLS